MSAQQAVETALVQAKTITTYLSELRMLGTYPELNDSSVLAKIKQEMENALRLSPWEDWVVIYQDGQVRGRTFKDPRTILTLLLKDINGEINSVMSEAQYEIMCDQLQIEEER